MKYKKQSDAIKLTPSDVGIISVLRQDARSSVSKIATKLKLPESTVRHRLNRLVQRDIIEFAAIADAFKLGYQIWAIIEIKTEVSRIRSVAHQIATAPEVYFVGISTGTYDVLVNAVFRSNEDLLDFITNRLSKIKGILSTTTSSILEVVKRSLSFEVPEEVIENGRRLGDRGTGHSSSTSKPETRRRHNAQRGRRGSMRS